MSQRFWPGWPTRVDPGIFDPKDHSSIARNSGKNITSKLFELVLKNVNDLL